jgi:hypothetical protein
MPDEHHDRIEIALSSRHGSDGSSLACGKFRAIHIWMAGLSVSGSPSIMSNGTLCFGLSRRYAGNRCSFLRKLSGFTSNEAFASVSVT